jgi:hypothetical protein
MKVYIEKGWKFVTTKLVIQRSRTCLHVTTELPKGYFFLLNSKGYCLPYNRQQCYDY